MFIFSSCSVGLAHCVMQLFLSYAFSPFSKQTFSLCNGVLRQRGKNKTKSNANENMRTYLLCIKK